MNQANQKVVIQNANMNLIAIRTFELNYFSNFFANFGTQSALMIGFIAGSISQVPGFDDPTNCSTFWTMEYWITSALCLGTAIAALISAFFILVFAQGLAIRGPEGSMIQSIQGMIIEQHYVVILFSFTLFFFMLQCLGMYYIMFDSTSALVTSIITGIGIFIMYYEGLRLYNRFYWGDKITTDWEVRDTEDHLNDLDPSLVKDLMSKQKKESKNKSIAEFAGKGKNHRQGKKRSSALQKGGGGEEADISDLGSELSADDLQSVMSGGTRRTKHKHGSEASFTLEPANENHLYGAYLTMRDRGTLGKEQWVRRYFLVRGHLLYYYRDKRTFELNPAQPINKRAIDLEGYTLVGGSKDAPFPISLIPHQTEDIRKVWKFRCDTAGEFERWIQLFARALQDCNPNQQQGELVMIVDGKSEVVSVMEDDDEDEEDD